MPSMRTSINSADIGKYGASLVGATYEPWVLSSVGLKHIVPVDICVDYF